MCVCKYIFEYTTLHIHVVDMVACFEYVPRFDCIVHLLLNSHISVVMFFFSWRLHFAQLTSKSSSIMFMPCMYGIRYNHTTTFCARFSWSKELLGNLYLTCFQ